VVFINYSFSTILGNYSKEYQIIVIYNYGYNLPDLKEFKCLKSSSLELRRGSP
jgi:hypothetical protein